MGYVRHLLSAAIIVFTIVMPAIASQKVPVHEYVIGINMELSGDVAPYGQSVSNAIKIAADEINKSGGISGKQIKLVEYDNKSDKDTSLNVVNQLITQDRVDAIIGPLTSGNTLPVVPIVESKKVPVLTPSATNPDVTVNPVTKKVKSMYFVLVS
ncbi:ABC transporter substrate-binding protein [Heliobacillus mobilis]|uniref:ABC transporter substrate-binding protein n=1 Tax=Heliobacterium mobile TaxID=28064 RepID=A0A6I3SI71_HELMO|nr:ABC transporter substrate-binding protein [Heliobacterium mobile]MTV48377.1 ABC transporter substrate-binding protein [Heliobacterium mobile]